jgi:hypothetical protein
MPVSQMLDQVSSKELSEWQAYFKVKKEMEKDPNPSGNTNKKATF